MTHETHRIGRGAEDYKKNSSSTRVTTKKEEQRKFAGATHMTVAVPIIKTNPLGDTTAENDSQMLSGAFIETADFRTLIESDDRTVVVGRRGTGKSALFIHLKKHWEKDKKR